jgi:hypothetical protein
MIGLSHIHRRFGLAFIAVLIPMALGYAPVYADGKSANWEGHASGPSSSAEISNSRLSRSTITDKAVLQFSRSAFPNLIPLTAQFVSSRDFGVRRSIKTPMKGSQRGSDLLTAVTMATSKVSHLICSRELTDLLFLARDIIIRSPYYKWGLS